MKITLNYQAIRKARQESKLSRDKLLAELINHKIPASNSVLATWEGTDFCPKSLQLFFGMCQILKKDPKDFICIKD